MKLLKKSVFSMVLTVFAATASANDTDQTGVAITGVQAGQSITGGTGPAEILFAANSSGTPPACVTAGNKNGYGIDPTTAQGRAALALAITAYLEGKTVNAFGAGQCSIYSGIEDLAYLITTD
jgi:hypothetical protein